MLVCTLGDALLDVIVRLEQPLAAGDDAIAVTRLEPGGQAANVSAWVVAVGARGRFVGRRGSDEAGRLVTTALERRGVEVLGPPPTGANGVVVSLVEPGGGRTMASDRGVAPDLAPADLDPTWLEGCDWLHIAGYSLLRSPIHAASLAAARLARRGGARVSVDVSSSATVQAYGAARFAQALRELDPDVLFATEPELAVLDGAVSAPVIVVKRGPRGFAVRRGDGSTEDFAALSVDPIDSTGAGDALAAGFLVGGPSLALEAAARCVAKVGAMP